MVYAIQLPIPSGPPQQIKLGSTPEAMLHHASDVADVPARIG